MKTLLVVPCACLLVVVCACFVNASSNGTDTLIASISLTTGERSKDSNSRTTTITVERNTIVWERDSSRNRRRGGATPSLRKEFKLLPADKAKLLKVIRSNNLLVTDSIEIPQDSSFYRYFRISVALTLGKRKGAINISGPRTAVQIKEEKLYQTTLTLVEELYRIMNSQDKEVNLEELILAPRTR